MGIETYPSPSIGLGKCALLLGVVAALASMPGNCAPSDATQSANVDAAIRQQMKDQKIPGVSIAVVRSGKSVKATGYGFANVEVSAPAKVETLFPAGSITKQFTASAIMLLVEEGRVGVDDSIVRYFPEAPAAWKAITIRHFLTHTSGIPEIFGSTEQILKRSSLEAMWTPLPIDDGSAYPSGMGWFIAKANGHRIVFHTGGGFGFYAVITRYLDDGLTIVVMTNIDEAHTDVLKIAGDVAAIYLSETKGANPIKDWQD